MQLPDVLCYIFITITVAASCVEAEDRQMNRMMSPRPGRGMNKRERIMIDHYPEESHYQVPRVVSYRRISHPQRFAPPKTKYGPPRPSYKTHKPKPSRKPSKKHRYHKSKHTSAKYLPPTHKHKKRNPKPRYGPPSKPRPRPSYAHEAQKPSYGPPVPDSTGFGEPPTNYANDYNPPKQSYGEPPTDSYGAPIQHSSYKKQKFPPWEDGLDANTAYSKRQPSFTKIEPDYFYSAQVPQDYDSSEELFQVNVKDNNYMFKQEKPQYFDDHSKVVKKPWKVLKKPVQEAEIIVGGQYAEPPPRYVPKHKHRVPTFDKVDDDFSPSQGFVGSEFGSSATISPYVNYKNSNLAFSPQNLNDAFSIVDK